MRYIKNILFIYCLFNVFACTGTSTEAPTPNTPPEFTSNNGVGVVNITIEEGTRDLNYSAQVADAENDPIALELKGRSAGDLILTGTTLNFKGSVNPVAGDIFNVRIIASDSKASATQHIKITVVNSALDDEAKVRLALETGNPALLPDTPAILISMIKQETDAFSDKSPLKGIYDVVRRLDSGDYSFELSECNSHDCASDPVKEAYENEFLKPLRNYRNHLSAYDVAGRDLFAENENLLGRLVILLGDYYRSRVKFPMDPVTSKMTDFLRSYFAEHVVYYSREHNPVMQDLGTFSKTDFSTVVPETVRVTTTSKLRMRAAGVYSLPGQTFTVTRNDESENLEVKVLINTLRFNSIKVPKQLREVNGELRGYVRPRLLISRSLAIKPGETIKMTSPYGGPVQLFFGASGEPVDVTFTNVGRHPYWNGPEDTEHFNKTLAEGVYNWVEVALPNFELHSRRDYFLEAMEKTPFKDIDDVAEGTQYYTHNLMHQAAGLKGPGINYNEGIHGFAEDRGWNIDQFDTVRHANAEFASCGVGCAGSPSSTSAALIAIDVYGSFNPLNLVYLHEIGHNIEDVDLIFPGWVKYHTLTELYASLAASEGFKKYNHPSNLTCMKLWRDDDLYQILQDSVNQPDPQAYVLEKVDFKNALNTRLIYLQLAAVAHNQGTIGNGWYFLARLNMLNSEYKRVIESETLWNTQRESLGFSTYTRAEAEIDVIAKNDWLVIAMSLVSGLDFSDYIAMWGIDISEKAKTQIQTFGFAKAQNKFYASELELACSLDLQELPIDGNSAWPFSPR